jgi:hypothetical protein
VERAECESVEFAEVEFTAPVVPRLVIRFSDGLRGGPGGRSQGLDWI